MKTFSPLVLLAVSSSAALVVAAPVQHPLRADNIDFERNYEGGSYWGRRDHSAYERNSQGGGSWENIDERGTIPIAADDPPAYERNSQGGGSWENIDERGTIPIAADNAEQEQRDSYGGQYWSKFELPEPGEDALDPVEFTSSAQPAVSVPASAPADSTLPISTDSTIAQSYDVVPLLKPVI